jgi:hypothetical protein
VTMLLEGRDGQGVGVRFLAAGGHTEESIPQGLKPRFMAGSERAKPEGLAYLEATAKTS